MQTIQYKTIDKSTWGDGPWQNEPDKMQFPDEATGLPCLIVRNSGGVLCGYVGVPKGHPAYEKSYDDIDIEVHGGLTFAGFCQKNAIEKGICHIPGPGEPDKVWWLGFDCSHSGDLSPVLELDLREYATKIRLPRLSHEFHETYKPISYVKREIRWLAEQLFKMK